MKRSWLSRLLVTALCMGLFTALVMPGKALAAEAADADALTEALGRAASGETVKLTADITTDEITVPAGVTLDLNGKTLTITENQLVADSGELLDSTDGTGLVKIAMNAPTLATNNPQFPVYDSAAEGYRLFDVTVQMTAPYRKYVENQPRLKGQYKLCFDNTDAYGLLAKGGHDVTMTVDITYDTGKVGDATFSFPEDLITAYGSQYASKVFGIGFKNYEQDTNYAAYARAELTNNVVFECCGVELMGSKGPFKPESNLALGIVPASSYSAISASYPIGRMTDGSTLMGLSNCSGLNYAANGSLIFDLGKQCTLTEYKIYNQSTPNDYGGIKSWVLQTSPDGVRWHTADTRVGDEGGLYSLKLKAVSARYVKLIATDAYGNPKGGDAKVIRIGEFEIYGWACPEYAVTYKDGDTVVGTASLPAGCPVGGPEGYVVLDWADERILMPEHDLTVNVARTENLASGIVAERTYSSLYSEINAPLNTPRMTDGIKNDLVNTSGSAGYIFKEDGYFKFDLGRRAILNGYTIVNVTNGTTIGSMTGWKLYTSLDGKDWGTEKDVVVNNAGGTYTFAFAEPVVARYIKLVATEANVNINDTVSPKRKEIRIVEFEAQGYALENNLTTADSKICQNLNAAVFSSTYTPSGALARNTNMLNDGVFSGTTALLGLKAGGYILIDLGKVYDLTAYNLVVPGLTDLTKDLNCAPTKWNIYYSADDTDVKVETMMHDSGSTEGLTPTADGAETVNNMVFTLLSSDQTFEDLRAKGISARYLKLEIKQVANLKSGLTAYTGDDDITFGTSGYPRFFEIEVFGR